MLHFEILSFLSVSDDFSSFFDGLIHI